MKILKSENFKLFILIFLAACAAGLYINLHLDFIFGDALVRTYHAYSVFFGYNYPKFSAIGFVWPPIPTLLQIPLILIKPLNNSGIAGNIFSALCFGVTAVYVNRLGKFFRVHPIIRYTILGLFITNPLLFFYGANGMTEMVGIMFAIMTLYYFFQHIASKSIPPICAAGFTMSFLILTRWETGIFLLILLPLIAGIHFVKKGYSFREVESSVILLLYPVVFAILVWLLINWLITGVVFQGSEQVSKTDSVFNSLNLLQFALKRLFLLSPAFVPLLVLSSLSTVKKARLYFLALTGFSLSMLFIHTTLFSLGRSVGELRYFIYIVPFTYLFLMFFLRDTLTISLKKFKYACTYIIITLAFIASSALTYQVMASEEYNNQEYIFIEALHNGRNNSLFYSFRTTKEIGQYIANHVHSRSILVDDAEAFAIIYYSKKPRLFFQQFDNDYKQVLDNPFGNGVEYILINEPQYIREDGLNDRYPDLFKEGSDFTTLEKDFGAWKLYKII